MSPIKVAVPFPEVQPPGYEWFDNEPAFDPDRHLALQEPDDVIMLTDLGYSADEIATKATAIAATTPMRILSDEGAAQMLETARQLRPFARRAGDRIERTTRGGCYRSKWLRDLSTSPEVTAHLSKIYGVDVSPHAMPVHLGHLNYEPSQIDVSIDKWHHDTIALDYVMMVTDPALVHGGQFEYFQGTKHEAADLAATGDVPPPERRVAPDVPGPGYAIVLHGDMVVHRAAPVTAECERITMVNAYMSLDPLVDEQSRSRDLIPVDDHEVLWTEWAKFAAWRSHGRLGNLLESLDFTPDREVVIAQLEASVADVQRAISDMKTGEVPQEHYGA